MALRGNLRDFSLPDVFQLVQLSRKTGVLRIQGADAEGSIWFRDGDVFFAQSNWRRDPLGQRLVAAQKITSAALAKALEIHRAEPAGGRRLGQILVDESYITPQVLEAFVQEQIQDTIFDLMRWDEGDFDFEVLPDVVHEDIGLTVSIENIVMEGSRRLEEWNRIKKKVPSTDMVFKMATAPGEGTFEISLKPVEWNLLLLVDGTRTVRELAVETRRTDFEVARVVYGLFSAGLLEVASDEEVERLRAERAKREDKRARLEAGRKARDDAQKAEALAIEATLAADAAARRTGAAPESAGAPAAEPEMPEFLAVGDTAPSADDMAVFEQMMEAVLTPPPVAPHERDTESETEPVADLQAAPPLEQEVAPEPEVAPRTVPEPEAEPVAEELAQPVFEVAPEPPAEEEGAGFGFGAIPPTEFADIPAPPVSEAPSTAAMPDLPAGFVPTGDLETDLRTLGLGELPEELREEARPEPIELEPEAEPQPQPEFTREPEIEPEIEPEPTVESGEEDLDALLASLGSDEAPTGLISSGTEFGEAEAPSAGVISTDAYLAEFEGDVALSSGLGDELTALTGGGNVRSRPVATVSKIPEAGEGVVLHRDQMVDKDLVLKIIEGIEKL